MVAATSPHRRPPSPGWGLFSWLNTLCVWLVAGGAVYARCTGLTRGALGSGQAYEHAVAENVTDLVLSCHAANCK